MTKNPDIYRVELSWGMYSRVAKALGRNRTHVARVASGQRRSPVVEAALRKELQRIDRLVKKREAAVAAKGCELERAA